MKNAIRTKSFTKGVSKTAITAAGMSGTAIGAYHVKNFVSDISDNEILGVAAGIAALLLGAVVFNGINRGVDKAFEVKNKHLLIEVPHDDFELELNDEEVDSLEKNQSI